jgi:peptidoglycan/LPS O-acetylase OafA/YrhL
MLGIFRFTLALSVAFNHLWIIGGIGRLAVFTFYIISGYLMTLIIEKTYGTSKEGIYRYFQNRLLRIYPSYLTFLIVTIVIVSFFSRATLVSFDTNLSLPSTFENWFMNLTLLGLDFSVTDRIIPPSWTLFVELFFYALIPILLRLNKKIILVWLLASIAYHAFRLYFSAASDPSAAWNSRYGTILAGSLGFSIGATAKLYLPDFLKKSSIVFLSFILFIASYLVTIVWALTGYDPSIYRIVSTYCFYGSMIFSVPIIDYACKLKPIKFDRLTGSLSYPFYLCHIPIGFFTYYLMGAQQKTWQTMALGITSSLLASYFLIILEKSVAHIRLKNKQIAIKNKN